MIPHGFGLEFQGKTYGANANRLAKNTHRDRFAGTPFPQVYSMQSRTG